jgi:hypothetical protein
MPAVKSWICILRYGIFQGNSGSQWNVTYVTPKKDVSGSSQHQQAKCNHQDSKAGKGCGDDDDDDDDMDITECLPLYNVTSNTFSSQRGKETNSHSAGCKMQPESVELCREAVTLPYTKKPRMKHGNGASGVSESDKKPKPSENAKKNQRRVHSARTNSKSLSKNTRTELRAVSKEAAIDRYVIGRQREPSSGRSFRTLERKMLLPSSRLWRKLSAKQLLARWPWR